MTQPTGYLKLLVTLFVCFLTATASVNAAGLSKVIAEKDKIILLGKNEKSSLRLVELAPYESPTNAASRKPVAVVKKKGRFKISIPRFDGERDRLYSAFAGIEANTIKHENFEERPAVLPLLGERAGVRASVGQPEKISKRFVEQWNNISQFTEPYPKSKSKKGLQVQMVDDAIALGVQHAAINFNFGGMVTLDPKTNDLTWQMDGRTFHFRRSYIEANDRTIKTLSDAGMTVTLILLNYEGGDAALNQLLLHPNYEASSEKLSAFNTSTPEGLAWFKACMEFIANRYSDPTIGNVLPASRWQGKRRVHRVAKDSSQSPASGTLAARYSHGRVVNYIVGNEVNSHRWWANMGRVTMEQFADDYGRTLRIANTAVRKFSSSARVFISLEHHWNIRFGAGDEKQSFPARPFIDYLGASTKCEGDFDWHLAFHPYPEDLFECRTWNDKSATFADDTPRITFKNLELLPRYFRRDELLYAGQPRHIVLSEQGFHSPPNPEGELRQAAAYCYAYYKTAHLDGIDSFILHRHVDHKAEYGLNLGLWRRKPDSIADPGEKKPIYEVFRTADTESWKQTFEFALPIIGIKSWEELGPVKR